MSNKLTLNKGTGCVCYTCGKKITKKQLQHEIKIGIPGWKVSAVVHANPKECV